MSGQAVRSRERFGSPYGSVHFDAGGNVIPRVPPPAEGEAEFQIFLARVLARLLKGRAN